MIRMIISFIRKPQVILPNPIALDWRTVPETASSISLAGTGSARVALPSAADLADAADAIRLRREFKGIGAEPSEQVESLRSRCEKKWASGGHPAASPEKAIESIQQRIENKAEFKPRRKASHSVELKEVAASSSRGCGGRARGHDSVRAKPKTLGEADPGAPPGKPKDLRLFLTCAAVRRARMRQMRYYLW